MMMLIGYKYDVVFGNDNIHKHNNCMNVQDQNK